MELFLIQHSEAKPKAEDPERSLTIAGVGAAQQMSDWAALAGVKISRIRHSGKLRAAQTAFIMAEGLAPEHGLQATQGINPLDDPTPLVEELRSEQESLMLVGHLPFLSRLAGMLLAGDPERSVVQFENAGIVCLRRTEGDWSVRWAMVPGLLSSG